MLISARSVLSERQLSVLEPDDEVDLDPSTMFLGLEWEAIFGKCFNLGINIRIYRQRLSSGHLDTLTLALVLRDLRRVVGEVDQHAHAVLRGKLGTVQIIKTDELSRSSQNICVPKQNRGVRYAKSKTEGLAQKIAKVARKGGDSELIPQKKKSIVSSLTNIFRS